MSEVTIKGVTWCRANGYDGGWWCTSASRLANGYDADTALDEVVRLREENARLRAAMAEAVQRLEGVAGLGRLAMEGLDANDPRASGQWASYYGLHGDPRVCMTNEDGGPRNGFGHIADVTTSTGDYGRAVCEFIAAACPALIARLDVDLRAALGGEA